MKRSDFLKNSSLLFGASLLTNNLTANPLEKGSGVVDSFANDPFKLNYGPHQGMFSASAGKNFLDEIKYMHDLGFRSIEDNGMPGRSPEEQKQIGDLL